MTNFFVGLEDNRTTYGVYVRYFAGAPAYLLEGGFLYRENAEERLRQYDGPTSTLNDWYDWFGNIDKQDTP